MMTARHRSYGNRDAISQSSVRGRATITRRDAIVVGALSCGLYPAFRCVANQQRIDGARSAILIWLDGGPSHLDLWDPKPMAPSEVRGPFGAIATSTPGVAVSELLPRTATVMNDIALIRSMTSPLGEHNLGTHYLLTGYQPSPSLTYPAIGTVMGHLQKSQGALPPHVAIPHHRVGGARFHDHGYLPPSSAAFAVGGDPGRPDFRVDNLLPPPYITSARRARRHDFVAMLDETDELMQGGRSANAVRNQAYDLVSSSAARKAFDLESEPNKVRNRYGQPVDWTKLPLGASASRRRCPIRNC